MEKLAAKVLNIKPRHLLFLLLIPTFIVFTSPVLGQSNGISQCTEITTPGTYQLTGDIVQSDSPCIKINSSDVTLIGNGNKIQGDDNEFSEAIFISPGSGDEHKTTFRNIIIKDLTVDGWGKGIANRVDVNVTELKIQNINATNVAEGINIDNELNGTIITVAGNRIHSNLDDGDGITIVARSPKNLNIGNNVIKNSTNNGIVLTGDDATVRNNKVKNSNQFITGLGGISITGDNNLIINNNVSFSRSDDGIEMRKTSTNNTVKNNIIIKANGQGIFDNGNNNDIINNTVKNNSVNGIYVQAPKSRIINNTVVKNRDTGIGFFTNGGNHIVVNNTVVSNDEEGIISDGNNSQIKNNIIISNNNGVFLEGFSNSSFINNNVSKNKLDGIQITKGGINQNGSNNIFKNNNINGNGDDGIVFGDEVHGNTFVNNTAIGNNRWAFTTFSRHVFSTYSNNSIKRLKISPGNIISVITPTISHIEDTQDIGFGKASPFEDDPSNLRSFNKYVELSSDRDSWFNISIHYNDSEVSELNESGLDVFHRSGSSWSTLSDSRVDTTQNIVTGNITTNSGVVTIFDGSLKNNGGSIIDQYDQNNNNDIDRDELRTAVLDFIDNKLSRNGLRKVILNFAR